MQTIPRYIKETVDFILGSKFQGCSKINDNGRSIIEAQIQIEVVWLKVKQLILLKNLS